MIRLFSAYSPIGLDLGSRYIHAAQINHSGEVIATAQLLRTKPGEPYEPEDFDRLSGVLYRRGFHGREIIITAPKPIIQRTSIDLPPIDSGAPLADIARSELARQTHQDSSSFEFAWWDAPQPPRHGSSTRAITVSCEHDKANALLDCTEQAGLIPLALLSPSTAIAAAAPAPEPGSLAGALDLGWSEATFVLRSTSQIVFERQLSGCELSGLVRTVSEKHRIDPERLTQYLDNTNTGESSSDAAVAELRENYLHSVGEEMRSSVEYLRSCEGSHEPTLITVLGGGARTPGIVDTVAEATDTATCVAPAPEGPELAGAIALASRRQSYTIGEAA